MIKQFTNKKQSNTYLSKLEEWVDKMNQSLTVQKERLTSPNLSTKQTLSDIMTYRDKLETETEMVQNQIKKIKPFPPLTRGHVILILDQKKFHRIIETRDNREVKWDNSIGDKYTHTSAKIIGKEKESFGWDRHTDTEGTYFCLQLFDTQKNFYHAYLSTDCNSKLIFQPYLFLPHPEHLNQITTMLPDLSQNPKELEKKLLDYYQT